MPRQHEEKVMLTAYGDFLASEWESSDEISWGRCSRYPGFWVYKCPKDFEFSAYSTWVLTPPVIPNKM